METHEISQEKIVADLTKARDNFISLKRTTDKDLVTVRANYQNMATYINRAIKLIEKQSALITAKNKILYDLEGALDHINISCEDAMSNADSWYSNDLNDYAEGM